MEEDDALTDPSDTDMETAKANTKEGEPFVVKKIPRKEKKKAAALKKKSGTAAASSAPKGVISKNVD